MRLDEIALELNRNDLPRVPEWTLGTVYRRSITFATGLEDRSTFVVWVQSHGRTGDLRINPSRPRLAPTERFEDLDLDTLVKLASVEGGVATTELRPDGLMAWNEWIGFQPYDKYPEPGILRRVGDCMIEFPPSGIYVEDWRFQPSRPGVLAGLTLLFETDEAGETRARNGGIVVAGDHVIQSVERREEITAGTRAQDFVRRSSNPLSAIARIMDCTVDYGVDDGRRTIVKASTDPRREGQASLPMTGFEPTNDPDVLIQVLDDGGAIRRRAWRIDSLMANVDFPLATAAGPDELAWLAREADTLTEPLRKEKEKVIP